MYHLQMCIPGLDKNDVNVSSIYNSQGEMDTEDANHDLLKLPEHVDDPYLDRDLKNGILGFRYENKKEIVIVYSSIEAKTFCMILHLKHMRN